MLENLTNYFAEIPSSHRTIIIVAGLTIFSLIESAVPLFSLKYNRWRHAVVNIFFTLTTILVNLLLAFLLLSASDWVVESGYGLLQMIDLHLGVELIIGLLFMDLLGSYAPHWCEHHVTWMWRFHAIHHTDQHIDVTSANRHHPGESVIRFVFTIAAAIVIGAPIWLIMLYQSLSLTLSQFNHSNIQLPKALDRILLLFVCTPNMHHVHHHYRLPYSDTNYGNIFPYWDHLFGTYTVVDNQKLKYGLDTHMTTREVTSIPSMLRQPFRPYRGRIEYDKEELL